MEKLDKVIAGLSGCICGLCSNCDYGDTDCHRDRLMEDALELLKEYRGLRSLPEDMMYEGALSAWCLGYADECRDRGDNDAYDVLRQVYHRLERLEGNLKIARAERDAARAKLARVIGEREAEWLAESPGTNYQKIKNMGPLHLTEWILKTVHPCECCDKQGVCGVPEDQVDDEYCSEHILAWLMQRDETPELRTCYCPLCDKHFEIHSNDSMGNCPECGHHVVLHREEENDE